MSVGASTDKSKMASYAVSAAISALGNISESERSTKSSAISQNINLHITDSDKQKALTGKTAEETLQSLNRHTENTNQVLEKQDLAKVQARQEMAQVIGELSQAGIKHVVGEHLEEANKKRAEADALANSDPAKAEALRAEAKAIESEYGVGSDLQMGVRAATAALQGLATGSVEGAVVGALSPYANKWIKENTTNPDQTVNTEANLIAHAILGAVEAHVTGNKAAAGAIGALTAEAAAPYIMQTLYGTDKVENLTDSQKQNVANLSQITAGLSSGLVGDSTASGIAGAEIGKRAVENNLLLTDYSNLKGLTKTETDAHRKTIQLLKDNGIENIDDYARHYAECSTDECKQGSLNELNKAFDKAYDKLDELAKSGQLELSDINAIDEYVSRIRSAYDSKRFSETDSNKVYFDGVINVLGKNEDRLNQARLYATVSDWALQGYSQEQIEDKLISENLATILSSASISIGKNNGSSARKPVVTKQQISEIVKGTVSISRSKHPETASHIEDAISQGKPAVLTIDRKGAAQRRKEALRDIPTKIGYDRDEYPPAMFKEGGKNSSVRYISPKDNRGAGSCIGHQCKQYADGDKVKIEIKD